jgi:hypothetical protein
MMKFLHTADLQLGKILHEQPLLEDQAAMPDQPGDIPGAPRPRRKE